MFVRNVYDSNTLDLLDVETTQEAELLIEKQSFVVFAVLKVSKDSEKVEARKK